MNPVGYQLVSLANSGFLLGYSRLLENLDAAVELATRAIDTVCVVDGPPDHNFIIGPFALYTCGGQKISDTRADAYYDMLIEISKDDTTSYAITYPMMYLFDRFPITKTGSRFYAVAIQYTMDGGAPKVLNCKGFSDDRHALEELSNMDIEPFDDGPVFKALIYHPSQLVSNKWGDWLFATRLVVYNKKGRYATHELIESVMGIRCHPCAAEPINATCSCFGKV